MMEDYWIKYWSMNNYFALDNDRLKKKSYVYAYFPKANLYGFQDGGFRHLVSADVIGRFLRLDHNNVLFPTGCHSLCYSAFLENKKLNNVINDDITDIFKNQMLKLGIGINNDAYIDMKHNEFLQALQQAFLDLYNKGYIAYKEAKVLYDKKKNKIYDTMTNYENLTIIKQKSFVLKIDSVIDDVINDINNLDCNDELKKKLINCFSPKKLMKLNLIVSNGSTLHVKLYEPQFLGGVSFIFLNPEFIDITNYIDINEYQSIISYLDSNSQMAFAYSGLSCKNPLTGNDIPIFISNMFKTDAYLGIPGADLDDLALANEDGLDIIDIIDDGHLINSDFLDGMTPNEAKNKIFEAFVEADMAEEVCYYDKHEILLSSLDNFGALFPFLEDKLSGEIYSLDGYLPYAFSKHLRPVLPDGANIEGSTMNGTINNLFIEGITPILAMLYDSIGAIVPILSNDAVKIYNEWNGIEYYYASKGDIYSSILMPLIFYRIIKNECGITNSLIHRLFLVDNVLDHRRKKIIRSNNNLIDLNQMLVKYHSDSIRLYFMKTKLDEEFVLNSYELEDINKALDECFIKLKENNQANSLSDYALYELINDSKLYLKAGNVCEYAKCVYNFIGEYILKSGLSKKQVLKFIVIAYPLIPFTCEEIYKEVFGGKYSVSNEDIPD